MICILKIYSLTIHDLHNFLLWFSRRQSLNFDWIWLKIGWKFSHENLSVSLSLPKKWTEKKCLIMSIFIIHAQTSWIHKKKIRLRQFHSIPFPKRKEKEKLTKSTTREIIKRSNKTEGTIWHNSRTTDAWFASCPKIG